MLSEAVPITACQYGAQLQLQWSSVPPEAGTQHLGGTCFTEQLYLSRGWLHGGDYIFVWIYLMVMVMFVFYLKIIYFWNFPDHGWSGVTENTESESADEGGQL